MLTVIGRVIESGDVVGQPTFLYQPVKFHRNIILRNAQFWFQVYNDPVFTSLSMSVYSLNNNVPKKLICTSTNQQMKADIHTLPYAVKGLRFDFDDVSFKDTDWYCFVPRAVGYAPTSSKFLLWNFGYPDPAYRLNVPLTSTADAGESPYDLRGIIGAVL